MNDIEKFKNISRRYSDFEKEVMKYREQFFTILWNGRITKEATKVFTPEELQKLKEMEDKLDALRKEYNETLSKLFG